VLSLTMLGPQRSELDEDADSTMMVRRTRPLHSG
jgi:hypothetical protein